MIISEIIKDKGIKVKYNTYDKWLKKYKYDFMIN